ncbi:uncharacterized protein LOC128216092 [Mya arenaria]|uniref:uncharacterized protein LOC128216092 n=1 Tax=Mya arenaria TaxID=6604 RepID=UPI0022E30925|nr:uncharacterized protein LOC128216092 [Mya arenaria]
MLLFESLFIRLCLHEDAYHNMLQYIKAEMLLLDGCIETTVKMELRNMYHSLDLKPLQRMTLDCNSREMEQLLQKHPFVEHRWKHNGEAFKLQPVRMEYMTEKLTINNLMPQDSGTYHCIAEEPSATQQVVAIYATVIGRLLKYTYRGDDLELDCLSNEFGKLYPKAIRYWIDPKGKRVFEKPAIDNLETFPKADDRLAGNWTCFVEDPVVPRKWTTARLQVFISPIPSFVKRTELFVKGNKIVSCIIIVLIIAAFLMLSQLVAKLSDKSENRVKKDMKHMKNVLGLKDKKKGSDDDDDDDDVDINDGMPLLNTTKT